MTAEGFTPSKSKAAPDIFKAVGRLKNLRSDKYNNSGIKS